jgi:hypothetical protein
MWVSGASETPVIFTGLHGVLSQNIDFYGHHSENLKFNIDETRLIKTTDISSCSCLIIQFTPVSALKSPIFCDLLPVPIVWPCLQSFNLEKLLYVCKVVLIVLHSYDSELG